MSLVERITPGLEGELAEVRAISLNPYEVLGALYQKYFDSKGDPRYSDDDRAFMLVEAEKHGHDQHAGRSLDPEVVRDTFDRLSRRHYSERRLAREITRQSVATPEEKNIEPPRRRGVALHGPKAPFFMNMSVEYFDGKGAADLMRGVED